MPKVRTHIWREMIRTVRTLQGLYHYGFFFCFLVIEVFPGRVNTVKRPIKAIKMWPVECAMQALTVRSALST